MATAKHDKGRGTGSGLLGGSTPAKHGRAHGQGNGAGGTGGQQSGAQTLVPAGANSKASTGHKAKGPARSGKAANSTGAATSKGSGGHKSASSGPSKQSKSSNAPVAVPAVSAPAATATAPTATPTPATSPATIGAADRAQTRSRTVSGRAGAGAGARGTAGAATGAALGVAGAAGAPTPGTGAFAAGATALGTAGGPGAHARAVRAATARTLGRDATDATPVARTAERIVSVIPWPMWLLIGVLAAMTIGLATRSWVSERQRRRLRKDVGLLQSALLPAVPAAMAGVATSAAYRPADGPGAGGDFYDLFELADGRLGVVVGDLSGHGREVLPQTALTRYTLRAYLDAGLAPRAALRMASGVLGHQLEVAFATVALAVYDPARRTLTYALAGHPPPFVLAEGETSAVTAAASAPLGTGLPTGARQTTVTLSGGATVCFYTDGLVEARRRGELFGDQRLRDTLDDLGPGADAEQLLRRVAERCDHRPDDMAACVLGFAGDALALVAREEELEVDRRELAGGRPERFLLACGVEAAAVPGILAAVGSALEEADAAVLSVALDGGSPVVRVVPHASEGLSALEPASDEERSLP